MAKDKCKSCGKKWIDHYDIQQTCAALQIALSTLRQISTSGRNSTRDRRNAKATLNFLATQLNPPKDQDQAPQGSGA